MKLAKQLKSLLNESSLWKGELELSLMKNPNGTFSFAGKVPVELMFEKEDGTPISDHEVSEIKKSQMPSLVKKKFGIKTRVWKNKQDAVNSAKELGVKDFKVVESVVTEETKLPKYDMVLKKLENKPAQKKAEFLEKALNDLVLKMLEKTTNLQDLKEWSNNFLLEVQGRAEKPEKSDDVPYIPRKNLDFFKNEIGDTYKDEVEKQKEVSKGVPYEDSYSGTNKPLQVGGEDILEKSKIKIHKYADSIKFWDLTFAGKKGKTVKSITIYDKKRDGRQSQILGMIKDGMTIDEIQLVANGMNKENDFDVYVNVEKAIEFPRIDQKEYEFSNDKFYIRSTPRDFTLADKEDQANLPRVINRDKVSPKKLYDFLTSNPNAGLIKDYNFSQMWGLLDKLGVKGHHYYGMD